VSNEKKTPLKFLIDQCLSPALAALCEERGYTALYVGHVKKLYGKTDPTIAKYAAANEYTLVTNDMFDFTKHYKISDHPGVICLTWADNMLQSKSSQIQMLEAALHFVDRDELYQELLEIRFHADEESEFWEALRYEWPHWP
jgi:predicted nuclease of predicted toxin-antitoxin system